MRARCLVLLLLTTPCMFVYGYEWRTHNGVARHSRALLGRAGTDPELMLFLDTMGEGELDTRAGDPFKDALIDEDATEIVPWGVFCEYREQPCYVESHPDWSICTFNHFFRPLPITYLAGLSETDAVSHAEVYFHLAVNLYKAGKCSDDPATAQHYKLWAARALGHALHLVQDMGSPQHARPENHAPYPKGHGWSFHEYWALDNWAATQNYTLPDGSRSVLVGGFEAAAGAAAVPFRAALPVIMTWAATTSAAFPLGSPFAPGRSTSFESLTRLFADSALKPEWSTSAEKSGVLERLASFKAREFPDYYRAASDDSGKADYEHHYDGSSLSPADDYGTTWVTDPLQAPVQIRSFELAERLWAAPDPLHPENPVVFDAHLKTLLKQTTEATAGAILAFWDEVKDYKCPCSGFTPCAFRTGAKDPDCSGLPHGPTPPGGDKPDDTSGVVGTTSALTTPSVADFSNPDLLAHWRAIAAVGVEKGVPSLVDFGRTMYLLSLSQDAHLTPAGTGTVARGVAELESKYSVDVRRPAEDLPKAAHVAVLFKGFAGEAATALDALGLSHVWAELTFDPIQLAEDHEVLFVPSGALFGTAESADLKARFEAYVRGGGTLLVMAQMRGADFTPVPVPPGEALSAYGWFEDQSCWTASVVVAAAHPATSALTEDRRSVNVDGFLDRWPSQATVLLRKSAGGMPVLLTYPLGSGRVIVTTIFEDWAQANGRSTGEGRALLADLVRGGIDPNVGTVACHWGAPCAPTLPVTLHNFTEAPADTVAYQLLDSRRGVVASWTQPFELEGGASSDTTVDVMVPNWEESGKPRPTGIYSVTYELRDSTRAVEVADGFASPRPWVVQPAGTVAGFVVEDWPPSAAGAPRVQLGLAVDSEYALPDSVVPIHVVIRNDGQDAFRGTLAFSVDGRGLQQVEAAADAGATSMFDAPVGPVTMTRGHDGLPGGATLRGELFVTGGQFPVATAMHSLLANTALLEGMLDASDTEAGVGDELSFLGHIANRSVGEVDARYRIVVTNEHNSGPEPCPPAMPEWTALHLGRDDQASIGGAYAVAAPCTGMLTAELYVCTPGQTCWTSGDGGLSLGQARVALPGTMVELSVGEFDIAPGPAFRLPIRVRNVGRRPVQGGTVGAAYGTFQGALEVRSAPFDLGRDGETTITLDLPFPPPGQPRVSTVIAGFTDRYRGGPEAPVGSWATVLEQRLLYGAELSVARGFEAPAGSGVVTGEIEIRNASTTTRRFELVLTQADLAFHDTRTFEIGPLQTITTPVTVQLPSTETYGTWTMPAHLTDGAQLATEATIVLRHLEPSLQLAIVPAAASVAPGVTAAVRVQLLPGALARTFTGALTFTCNALSVSESRTVTVESLTASAEEFDVDVPADFAGGAIPIGARFAWPDGREATSSATLVVPPPSFEVVPLNDSGAAGGSVAYRVSNVSTTPGTCSLVWNLRDGSVGVSQQRLEMRVGSGEAASATFTIPPFTASGRYSVDVIWRAPDGTRHVFHDLDITGVTSGLSVGTGQTAYAVGQAIDGWAHATNGAAAFPEAMLTLKVVAPELCERRLEPWGTYQGGPSRSGASPHRSVPPATLRSGFCFASYATLPSPSIPVAEAAGDLNEDGTDDLVTLVQSTDGLALTLGAGPSLVTSRTVVLTGASRQAALSAVDADGDGHLEVIEADTGDGTALAVRCLDRALNLKWDVRVGQTTTAFNPFPAGGPIVVDPDGSGLPALVVSTGTDVVALEPADGAVRWRMTVVNPNLAGLYVTGIAAADVDRDGRVEVAAGLRAPAQPGGDVVLLDQGGSVRWRHTTAQPVTGAPVVVVGDVPSLAIIQTPDDPTGGSRLDLLDARTGLEISSTTVAFRSIFGPAAADVNGDGSPELVVAAGDPSCASCSVRAALAFSLNGSRIWSANLAGPPTGPPIAIDMDGSGTADILLDYAAAGSKDGLACLRGHDGALLGLGYSLESPPSHTLPLLLMSPSGGCLPAIVSGRNVVKASACGGPHVRALGAPPAVEGETLWRWEGSSSLAASQPWDVAQTLSTANRAGLFYLIGDLKNQAGQVVAHAESTFSVVGYSCPLTSLDPLSEAYRPTDALAVTGTIRNTGAATTQYVLAFLLDNVEAARQSVEVDAAAAGPFSQNLAMPAVGTHTLALKAWSSALPSMTATEQQPFEVVAPAVDLALDAPPVVGAQPFTVTARVINRTRLPVALLVGLDPLGSPQAPGTSVSVPGRGTANVRFTRQISASTTFVAHTSGDATHETQAAVTYEAAPSLSLAGPVVRPAGDTVLGIELANSTDQAWNGNLSWTLTGATTAAGTVSAVALPHSVAQLDVSTSLAPGNSTLRLAAGAVVREVALTAYSGGLATLAANVPSHSAAGETLAALRVTNLLPDASTLTAVLVVEDDSTGSVVETRSRVWALPPRGELDDAVPLDVGPGAYRLVAALQGSPAGAPLPFRVIPRLAAEVEATPEPLGSDGTLPLLVTVRNSGGAEIAGSLTVDGPDATLLAQPLVLPPGTPASVHLPLKPDRLPLAELPLDIRFRAASGEVLVERAVSVQILPAALASGPVPLAVSADAGGPAVIPFAVTNAGMRTGHFELRVKVNGGTVAATTMEGDVAGHGTENVSASILIPGDLASCRLTADYTLLAADVTDDRLRTVATGTVPIEVHGLDLSVKASLDRDRVAPGEAVTLTLSVASPGYGSPVPLVARVNAPPFAESRTFELDQGGTELRFVVPIAEPSCEVGFGVSTVSGRALFLDSIPVRSNADTVQLSLDRPEVRPGETLNVTADLRSPGTLELSGLGHPASLSGSGVVALPIPSGLAYGRYPILWTFYGSEPGAGVVNGQLSVRVRGPWVRIAALSLASGPTERQRTALADVISDADLPVRVRVWLVSPGGGSSVVYEGTATLRSEQTTRLELPFTFAPEGRGTQTCLLALLGTDGAELVTAATAIDVAGATILGMRTDRPSYPHAGDPVHALVDAQGSGAASISLRLDGQPVTTLQVELDGIRRLDLPLDGVGPGTHTLEATLDSALGAPPVTTTFSVGTALPDLAVDLAGTSDDDGSVRLVAKVRNTGQAEAAATDLTVWDGAAGSGTLVAETSAEPLAPGAEALVPLEIALPQGEHDLEAWVNRSGTVQEFDASNDVARLHLTVAAVAPTPTPTPTSTPTPTPLPTGATVRAGARVYRIGDTVTVRGEAPDGTYCAIVVANGTWTLGAAPPDDPVAAVTVTSSDGVIPTTDVWPSVAAGSYDVLLVSGPCGAPGGAIVAAFDVGTAPGFDVTAGGDPIPALSGGTAWAFALTLTALGAWLLAGRRA